MAKLPLPDFASEFAASMPDEYRARYDGAAILDHANLAYHRPPGLVAAGMFRSPGPGMPVCIVASARPGVLSLISAACVMTHLDVLEADAYCRRLPDGGLEAIDMLWVRRLREPQTAVSVSHRDIRALRNALVLLTSDSFQRKELEDIAQETPASPGGTLVGVSQGPGGAIESVDVEAIDRPGLLFNITDELYELGLQITRSEIRTFGKRVHDRFFIEEKDGTAVAGARADDIRERVLSRLESPTDSPSNDARAQAS